MSLNESTLSPQTGVLAEFSAFFDEIETEQEFSDPYKLHYKQSNMCCTYSDRWGVFKVYIAFRNAEEGTQLYGFVVTGEQRKELAASGVWTYTPDGKTHLQAALHNTGHLLPQQWLKLAEILRAACHNSRIERAIELSKAERDVMRELAKSTDLPAPLGAAMDVIDRLTPKALWPIMASPETLPVTDEETRIAAFERFATSSAKKARKRKGR